MQHQRNWWQPPLPPVRLPSRVNGGAPISSARPQLPICPHCPISIRSTRPIKPVKPDPPSHLQDNTPSSVIQSRLFHRITFPYKPFLNRHAIRCEPFLSLLNRSPSPPSHFRTDTPSAVIQSYNSSSDSSFINDYSGIKQFFSAYNYVYSASSFASF